MLSLSHTLDEQLQAAMRRAFPEADAGLDPQLAPASKPEFGDFQANGALPLAKPLKQAPRQIATAIVDKLQADPAQEIVSAELFGMKPSPHEGSVLHLA